MDEAQHVLRLPQFVPRNHYVLRHAHLLLLCDTGPHLGHGSTRPERSTARQAVTAADAQGEPRRSRLRVPRVNDVERHRMARRHSTPQDFQLVGMSSDPTPGDPDLILEITTRYRDIGDAAEKALNILKRDGSISRGRGETIAALQKKIGDDLPDKLRKTATSYHDAAQAYADYAPRLREAQETLDRAVDQAATAAPQANQTVPALGEDPSDEEKAEVNKQKDAVAAGQESLNAAKSLAQQAREMRESAQRGFEEVLDRAASEAIPERNIFQRIADFFRDFPFVKILLGALLAIVAVFFPVAGALLGGALFALETITAIATDHFSLGDFALGLIALVPGGSLLRAAGAGVRGVTASAGSAVRGSRAVHGPIDSVAASVNHTKPVGGFLNGPRGEAVKEIGRDFAHDAGSEAVDQAVEGEGFDAGAILGAGAAGAAGTAFGVAARNLPFPRKGAGSGTSSTGGTATRSAPDAPGDSSPAPGSAPTATTSATPDAAPATRNPDTPEQVPASTGPDNAPAVTGAAVTGAAAAGAAAAGAAAVGAKKKAKGSKPPAKTVQPPVFRPGGGNNVFKPGNASAATKQRFAALEDALNRDKSSLDLSRFEKMPGSHGLARHNGKTDDELRGRLTDNPHLTAASTFKDQAAAERAAAKTLKGNQGKILDLLKRPGGSRETLDAPISSDEGTVFVRNRKGELVERPVTQAKTVIERDVSPGNKFGFKIITHFPEA
ncbi:RNase A-like domain-containing protein [Streptomyces althioticus]|uniref:RNase A-like domain-containing protein n=1 Tax=Streptomyces althioticus TaxID=83380 RepID=UPI0037BB3B7E